MKNAELNAICKEKNLRICRNKINLIEGILHHFRVGATELKRNEYAAPVNHPYNSRWYILQPNADPIVLPSDKGFFNSIIRYINPSELVVRRFNFPDRFERESFNEVIDPTFLIDEVKPE